MEMHVSLTINSNSHIQSQGAKEQIEDLDEVVSPCNAIGESASDTIKTLQHISLLHLAFCSIMCEKTNLSEVLNN
jgi:hypothetical protein